MATLSGSFTAPGVSGSVAATTTVTFSLSGLINRGAFSFEKSTDGGTTWTAFSGQDGLLAPIRGNGPDVEGSAATGGTAGAPVTLTWPVSAGLFRINCTTFDSGWCNWTITTA
jgi:hypothetical protein